jgi:crotonobetainyl-CoA:carnitine CoA-transferase CaiB-like acyl-CoA transferase
MRHQDELDALVAEMTVHRDGYELMRVLQAAGVPAGVCQTAADRYEADPQLRFGQWLTEVPHSEIGTWPVKELSGVLSKTPSHIGGTVGRSGPCYGEDNAYVLGEILGKTPAEIAELARQGVL